MHICLIEDIVLQGIKGAYRKLHLFKGEMTLMNPSEGNKKPVVTDIKF